VPAYLAAQSWTQAEVGAVLSVDTLASMFSQVPAGALVDAMPRRRTLLAVTLSLVAVAALILAAAPAHLPVFLALVLHSIAISVVAPAIAAVSLLLSGQCGLGERMGRNARYAALGGIVGAAAMGTIGSAVSARAVFLLTAFLAVPALYALRRSLDGEEVHQDAHGCLPEQASSPVAPLALLRDRRLVIFGVCVFLFFLSNAAVIPTAVGAGARSPTPYSPLMIAALIIVPQLIVAIVSVRVGHAAEHFGRRPLLLLGFASLPLRAALFATTQLPAAVVLVQPLEGLGAAVFGVMLPLVAADLTRGTGRYNLCLGLLGFMAASGAAASTTFAGTMADALSPEASFLALSAVGLLAFALIGIAMPETYAKSPTEQTEKRVATRQQSIAD
jgi:MFS family permease